jgi:phosphodiesterase/alkaline phosphatase D-like protein
VSSPVFAEQLTPAFATTAQKTAYQSDLDGGAVWTPTNGWIVVVDVVSSKSSDPDIPVLTGNGQQWDQVGTGLFHGTSPAANDRITRFRAKIAGASSGPLKADFTNQQTGCIIRVIAITSGADTGGVNGANALGPQVFTLCQNQASPAVSTSLGSIPQAGDGTLAAFAEGGSSLATTPEAGYTGGTEATYATPSTLLRQLWTINGDATPSVTYGAGNPDGAFLACWVKQPPLPSNTSITHGPTAWEVTDRDALVAFRADSQGNVTLQIGRDPGLADAASQVFAVDSSTDFAAVVTVSGLLENTRYYHRAVGDVTSSTIHTFMTWPTSPTSVKLAYLTDFQNLNPVDGQPVSTPPVATFVAVEAEQVDGILIGGDFDHSNPGDSDFATAQTNTRAMYRRLLDPNAAHLPNAMPDFMTRVLFKTRVDGHSWDDHDYRSNNSNKGYNNKDVVGKAVFAQYMGLKGAPAIAGAIWRGRQYGGLLQLIILDGRSQRDPNNTPDDANKSMLDGDALGATGQKQFFKDQLLAAQQAGVVWKLVMMQTPWNHTAIKASAPPAVPPFDNWYGYQTEQRELRAWIAANGIHNVLLLTGDVHAGFLEDGSSDPLNLPECVGPVPNFVVGGGETINNFDTPGTWSHGIWDAGGQLPAANGYTLLEISYSQLQVTIKDSTGATQLSMTLTAEGAPAPGDYVFAQDHVLPGGVMVLHRAGQLSPAAVAAHTTAEQSFTCMGARLGDVVTVVKPSAQTGLGIAGARVPAADQVAINFLNDTAAPITPAASETYVVRLARKPS